MKALLPYKNGAPKSHHVLYTSPLCIQFLHSLVPATQLAKIICARNLDRHSRRNIMQIATEPSLLISFLDLIPEIRNTIYELLFQYHGPMPLAYHFGTNVGVDEHFHTFTLSLIVLATNAIFLMRLIAVTSSRSSVQLEASIFLLLVARLTMKPIESCIHGTSSSATTHEFGT